MATTVGQRCGQIACSKAAQLPRLGDNEGRLGGKQLGTARGFAEATKKALCWQVNVWQVAWWTVDGVSIPWVA